MPPRRKAPKDDAPQGPILACAMCAEPVDKPHKSTCPHVPRMKPSAEGGHSYVPNVARDQCREWAPPLDTDYPAKRRQRA